MHDSHGGAPAAGTSEPGLAARLLDRFTARVERRGSPMWFEAGADGHTREVRRAHGLLGYRVGPGWDAAAVVATGRVRSLAPDAALQPELAPAAHGGLRLACAVLRDGTVSWEMRLPGGVSCPAAPEEGMVLDILRRAVAVATPPPPPSTVDLQLAVWLSAIAGPGGPAGAAGGRLEWEQALHLHPALAGGPPTPVEQAEALVLAVSGVGDWESLRLLAVDGMASAGAVMPARDLAAWMDSGMFARWTLSRLPSTVTVLATVADRLRPAAWRRLLRLIDELGRRCGA